MYENLIWGLKGLNFEPENSYEKIYYSVGKNQIIVLFVILLFIFQWK